MFCDYCGYGPLPANAPCCYMCGRSGPYSTQPPSITKRGLPRLSGQCPRCLSLNTVSGKENLKRDATSFIVLGIFTLGLGWLVFIPFMLYMVVAGYYIPNRYECIMCKHKWNEDAQV